MMIVTYVVTPEHGEDIEARVANLAGHFYPGATSVVAGEWPEMRDRHAGRVLSITDVPDRQIEFPQSARDEFLVRMATPIESMGDNLAMSMTLAAGDVLAFGKVKLVDLSFPHACLKMFAGPKSGIPGLRRFLGVGQLLLLMGVFKPCVGYPAEQAAQTFFEVAVGGADDVKDDELMADPCYCRRVD